MRREELDALEHAYRVLDGLRCLPLADALADGLLDFLDGAALLGLGAAPDDHEPELLDGAAMHQANAGQSTPLRNETRVPT